MLADFPFVWWIGAGAKVLPFEQVQTVVRESLLRFAETAVALGNVENDAGAPGNLHGPGAAAPGLLETVIGLPQNRNQAFGHVVGFTQFRDALAGIENNGK